MNTTRIQNLENGIKELRQQVATLTETISLLTTEGENRLQTIQQLTQERDSLLQVHEWLRGTPDFDAGYKLCALGKFKELKDAEAQAQKYKDKLTRCSAMFDEVEDSLADSCRREGKLKMALSGCLGFIEELEDHGIKNWSGKEIAQQALQKENICPACNGNNKDMPCAYPSEGMKGCLRDKKDMVLIPREPTAALLNIIARPIFPEDWDVGKEKQVQNLKAGLGLDQIPPVAEMESAYGQYKRLIEVVEDKPDLSKCPNCGGPADNGHDRCDPPNVYSCTECTKSEEGKALGALFRGAIVCKHGKGLTDYCEPCGRISSKC